MEFPDDQEPRSQRLGDIAWECLMLVGLLVLMGDRARGGRTQPADGLHRHFVRARVSGMSRGRAIWLIVLLIPVVGLWIGAAVGLDDRLAHWVVTGKF